MFRSVVPGPPGVVMVARQTLVRNGSRTQSEGRAENEKLGDISKTAQPLQNLTPSPLNVVNVPCSVFKAQERGYAGCLAR